MDNLIRSVGIGVHCYQPFRHSSHSNCVADLQYACKLVILRYMGLKRLKTRNLPLPGLLMSYLTTLSSEEFDEVECAPFIDLFDLHFCHRALTYKVRCRIDGDEYLATYGSCRADENREGWIRMDHCHVMSIYATVVDEATGNEFYLLEMPTTTLHNVRDVAIRSNFILPEYQVWKLLHQLTSALLHLNSLGLRYGTFGLENLYVTAKDVILENELTKKSRLEKTDSMGISGNKHYMEDETSLTENLGCVLNKLIRVAGRNAYSAELIRLAEGCQSCDPSIQPALKDVHRLSDKMYSKSYSCDESLCNLLEENATKTYRDV